MERQIEQHFKTFNTRLKVVEVGYKDYKTFKPVVLIGLKSVSHLEKELSRFKNTVFEMMSDLNTAMERLSGMRLVYGDILNRHQIAHSCN